MSDQASLGRLVIVSSVLLDFSLLIPLEDSALRSDESKFEYEIFRKSHESADQDRN